MNRTDDSETERQGNGVCVTIGDVKSLNIERNVLQTEFAGRSL
ncbi:hypothetical protein [Macrococcus carouselicus]|nr:hypothetical protein [Macrococcus carouselicus]